MAKNPLLDQLAKLCGVHTSYIDMRKRRIPASEESVRLALHALGALERPDSDVKTALNLRKDEITTRVTEPVLIAWDGKLPRANQRLPRKAVLTLEDGSTAAWPPKSLPYGYHRLEVQDQGRTTESLVISAPSKANFPLQERAWGVFAPAYSLHSKRSLGAGDLTDLESVGDWMHKRGGKVLSSLPLLANYLDEPFEPSPYSPISRMFWNEFYIDPTRAPEFAGANSKQRNAASTPAITQHVDYRETMTAKRSVLEDLARSFFSKKESSRYEEFRVFLRSKPEVSQYARFRAVTDRQRRGWKDWPRRMRDGSIGAGDFEGATYQYHIYVQWLIQEQLGHLATSTRNSEAMLYLDLPLGLHANSYDAWRYPELFVKGMAGGAPPDPVFTTGQNWAFPPMHPEAMRRQQYKYMIAYVRNHLQYARLLRIDHVMGLHRLYWIPEGLPGEKGVYVSYPAEEMYAVLSLESHRYGAGIIGENLGVVPPAVNRALEKHNIRPLYVVQFETALDSRRNVLRKPPKGSVASLNTHDMFPFRAFLEGGDIADHLKLKFLSKKEAVAERKQRSLVRKALAGFVAHGNSSADSIFSGCNQFLGKSDASIVLMNLEDLWQEKKPQNIPATTTERPNWRRRMRYSVERLRDSKKIQMKVDALDQARKKALK